MQDDYGVRISFDQLRICWLISSSSVAIWFSLNDLSIDGASGQKRKRRKVHKGWGFLQLALAFSQLCKFISVLHWIIFIANSELVTLQSTLLIRSLQCTCSSTEYVHMHVTLILSFSLVECRLSYIIKFCGGGYTPYVKQAESIFQ